MLGYDPGHSGLNPTETVLGVGNVGGLVQKWKILRKTFVYCDPTVVDGVLYSGNISGGTVNAFNAATGALVWSTPGYSTTGPTSLAVVDGLVYTAAKAFDATTGAPVWSHDIGATESSPVVVNGIEYVGANNHEVYAFDAKSGGLLWSHTTGSYVTASPAVANGVVYFASWDGKVYAYDAVTGATVPGGFSAGGAIPFAPVVVDGVVYVVAQARHRALVAADAATGAVLWQWRNASLLTPPAVAAGVIYLNLSSNTWYRSTVVALSASDRTRLWTYRDHHGNVLSPTIANGVLYTGGFQALDAATGAVLWHLRIGSSATSATISDGTVYVETLGITAFALPPI
jgi:outer membrane protein assembly factor BamB